MESGVSPADELHSYPVRRASTQPFGIAFYGGPTTSFSARWKFLHSSRPRIDWPNKMGPLPKPQGWQFHPDSQWNGQTASTVFPQGNVFSRSNRFDTVLLGMDFHTSPKSSTPRLLLRLRLRSPRHTRPMPRMRIGARKSDDFKLTRCRGLRIVFVISRIGSAARLTPE